jgi:glycine/D-amino acid oxidase-like deaminating enzyme
MGYSSDLVPHVGEVPGVPGQYICAGFSGHGMPQIFGASKAVAGMIMDGVSFEQTGLPPMFKATQERLDSPSNLMEESLKAAWERPRGKL